MLEMPILEYRVVYKYSHDIRIEVSKVGLDWAWVVRRDGEVLRADVESSESAAERTAVEFARGC
ncbi:hypothetical protein KA005_09325 [bacterium]|nr:hypothetical protein [bacterium]